MRLLFVFICLTKVFIGQVADTSWRELLKISNDTERVNQLYKKGFELRNVNPHIAFQIGKTAEELAITTQSPKHIAKTYNLLGVMYYKRSDFSNALNYHQKALRLRKQVNDRLGIAISETNLGNIYTDLKYFQKAELSYLDALEQYKTLNDLLQEARCLINLGVLKHEQKQWQASIQNFKRAQEIGQNLTNYEIQAMTNHNIGEMLAEIGQLDTATLYIEEGLKMRELMDNDFEKADSYLALAFIYIKKKDPANAQTFLDISESIIREYDYTEAKVKWLKLKSELAFMQKDYEQAYLNLKQYQQLQDSILNIDKEKLILIDEPLPDTVSNSTSLLANVWFWVSMGSFLIAFLLFILRNKT